MDLRRSTTEEMPARLTRAAATALVQAQLGDRAVCTLVRGIRIPSFGIPIHIALSSARMLLNGLRTRALCNGHRPCLLALARSRASTLWKTASPFVACALIVVTCVGRRPALCVGHRLRCRARQREARTLAGVREPRRPPDGAQVQAFPAHTWPRGLAAYCATGRGVGERSLFLYMQRPTGPPQVLVVSRLLKETTLTIGRAGHALWVASPWAPLLIRVGSGDRVTVDPDEAKDLYDDNIYSDGATTRT